MGIAASECRLVQVLKLLHHPDEYVSREAFLLADALIQQVPWRLALLGVFAAASDRAESTAPVTPPQTMPGLKLYRAPQVC